MEPQAEPGSGMKYLYPFPKTVDKLRLIEGPLEYRSKVCGGLPGVCRGVDKSLEDELSGAGCIGGGSAGADGVFLPRQGGASVAGGLTCPPALCRAWLRGAGCAGQAYSNSKEV